jgi:MFS family permease
MHVFDSRSIEDAERDDPSTTRSSTVINEKTVDVSLKGVDSKEQKDVEVAGQTTTEFTFPEGGLTAWSTVFGGFLVQFVCFGYISSYGVYQDFYVRHYLRNFSTSQIGWIGGVQIFLNFAPGIFAGRLFDRGYFRYLMTASIIIYAVSLFTLSLAHENSYYQIFLTNGVGLGLSSGLTYAAVLALPGHYFKRRRAIAVGMVSSGSAVGGILHPILVNKLVNGPVGFHNAVRISASMNVSLLILAACLMRTRLPPKPKAQEFPVMQWLKEPAYLPMVLRYATNPQI